MDKTEETRRQLTAKVNGQAQTDDMESERARLRQAHGEVWNTEELSRDFRVIGFMAPFVVVQEKSSGRKESLLFQDHPRFYFGFYYDFKNKEESR